jgi:zinc transport system substrate-binding protein
MKRPTTFRLSLLLLLLSLALSCTDKRVDSDEKVITVSILPFKYFVNAIAGDDYRINVIVPPGASPATFEPPPSVIRSLQQSKLIVFNGYLGFEQAWMDKLMQVNPDINVLYLASNQELIAAEQHKHGDHYHYDGVDPHFWMSPLSARQIALDIRDFLVLNYPDDSKLFNNNYEDLLAEIGELDSFVRGLLTGLEAKSFLIFHPALSYFARDYNLTQIPIEFEGKEPSASWLGEVIGFALDEDISTIMVQKEFNRKSAETIAKEIGADVVDISPLSDDWVQAVKDIALSISNMDKK